MAERFDDVQPFLSHVLEFEAAAGVDEELVEAVRLERGDLVCDCGVGGAPRDREKRNDGVRPDAHGKVSQGGRHGG